MIGRKEYPVLSPELERFVSEWLVKANQYSSGSIEDCYDKFFTLFVIFNRLYAEATFELARRGVVKLQPNKSLPDRKGATDHTLGLIGLPAFQELYSKRLAPYAEEIAILIDGGRFFIKLSAPDGNRQPDKDAALLAELRSTGKTRAFAVLDLVYTVRCNLFHGHKAFQPIQVELLRPTIAILSAVIESLHLALNR
jgi:hypothetical protein